MSGIFTILVSLMMFIIALTQLLKVLYKNNNYRIVRHIKYDHNTYEVQKRSLFGFWYNFNNRNGYITGIYDNFDEAKEAINRDRFKEIKEVIKV